MVGARGRADGDDARGVHYGHGIARHLAWLRLHAALPMDSLFAVRRGSREFELDPATTAAVYAESWALIHHLMRGDAGATISD